MLSNLQLPLVKFDLGNFVEGTSERCHSMLDDLSEEHECKQRRGVHSRIRNCPKFG